MKRTTLDLWVGLFAALGCAALLFLALRAANLTTSVANEPYTLYAEFDNIGGLKVKAPVKMAGVVVGRVAGIELDRKSFRARATLVVDKSYTFSRDVSAEILTSGLLGEQYIGLMQGGDPDDLANGDTITITSSALVLEQLIGKFMTNFAEGNAQPTAASDAPEAP